MNRNKCGPSGNTDEALKRGVFSGLERFESRYAKGLVVLVIALALFFFATLAWIIEYHYDKVEKSGQVWMLWTLGGLVLALVLLAAYKIYVIVKGGNQ